MQFTLLAAALLALALSGAQVQARPLTRSVTYMTYATDLYVDPWVVMQGQRAASTASETALSVATQALPSPATGLSSAMGTATTLSSSATSIATALSSSATGTATALSSSLTVEAASSTESASESESEPPASATEEEQYYSIQTQNAD